MYEEDLALNNLQGLIQHMLSTDPSYDNRTIASTLKMQIRIASNNRACPEWWNQSFRRRLWYL